MGLGNRIQDVAWGEGQSEGSKRDTELAEQEQQQQQNAACFIHSLDATCKY